MAHPMVRAHQQAQQQQHRGFAAVQSEIARKTNPRTGKPYGKKVAGAIVAEAARNASAKAKRVNPRLKRVKG